jgi:hypothetical protein
MERGCTRFCIRAFQGQFYQVERGGVLLAVSRVPWEPSLARMQDALAGLLECRRCLLFAGDFGKNRFLGRISMLPRVYGEMAIRGGGLSTFEED